MATAIGPFVGAGTEPHLDLIVGPMFAGKSSEVIRLLRRYHFTQVPVLAVHHALDTRYAATGGFIVTHDGIREPAHSLSRLADAWALPGFDRAQVVVIEEAQFFDPDDLVSSVTRLVEHENKSVVVAALDGNWQRHPFPGVSRLIPLADSVQRLQALCAVCRNGTPALFTQRWNVDTGVDVNTAIAVGGSEMYRPVCRRHYMHSTADPVGCT